MNREVSKGELVLIVTNHEGVEVPTIGVSQGTTQEKRNYKSTKLWEYIHISNALRLAPGVIGTSKGEWFPASNLISSDTRFNLDIEGVRLYVGKPEVLEYLGRSGRFDDHLNWVGALTQPYSKTMPKVKTLAYIGR